MKGTQIVHKTKGALRLFALVLALGAGAYAQASTDFWIGGDGSWDTSSYNWTNAAGVSILFANGDDAVMSLINRNLNKSNQEPQEST
jgi:hypothetical protein